MMQRPRLSKKLAEPAPLDLHSSGSTIEVAGDGAEPFVDQVAPGPYDVAPDAGDRYTLLQEIATGTFGVVYRARDEQLRREVAVSCLAVSGVADDIEEFRTETRNSRR